MMSSFPKILKIIFVILILVTFGEVGYYVYIQFSREKEFQKVASVGLTSRDAPTISLTNKLLNIEENKELNKIKYKIYHKMIDTGMMLSSIRTDRVQSEIIDIDTKGGVINRYKYKLKLTIKVGDDDKNDYYFSEFDLTKMKIFKLIDGREYPINLDELKPKDKIILETKVDLLKEPNVGLLELKITKI